MYLDEIRAVIEKALYNISTIEQLSEQLNEKDRTKLDREIRLLRAEIDRETTEFQTLRQQAVASTMDTTPTPTNETTPIIDNDTDHTDQETASNELRQRHVTTTTTESFDDSYKKLIEEIQVLNEIVGEVAQLTAQQREKISHTERLIDMAHDRIHDASTLLQKAVHSKYATTVSGALLGASLGGPVGFVLGLKMGTIAALGGSAFGALSANLLQRGITRHDQANDNNSSYNQAML